MKRLALLAALLVAAVPAWADGFFDVETGLVHDNNHNRSHRATDRRADGAVFAEVTGGWRLDAGGSNLSFSASAGGEVFDRFPGASHAGLGAAVGWRRKLGLGPTAPILRLGLDARMQSFDGPLRSGSTTTASARLDRRLNDTWSLQAALIGERRDADDATYDQRAWTLRLGASATVGETLFSLRFSGRNGDVTSVASPNPTILAAAEVKATDDVYSPGWVAYRLDGRTWVASLGLNHPLGRHASVDVRVERQLTSTDADGLSYDNQVLRGSLFWSF